MSNKKLSAVEWRFALEDKLSRLEEIYRTARPLEVRQAACTNALIAVVDALRDLPRETSITCLEDLAHALFENSQGRSAELLRPPKSGPGGRDLSPSEESARDKAIVLTEVLIAAGWQEKSAVHQVADWMAKAGFVGSRQRQPVTASTVRYWRAASNNGDDPARRLLLTDQVADLCSIMGQAVGSWPPADDAARQAVSKAAEVAVGRPRP